MDVIHMFAEQEARDELGIGIVRDAFADFLFPGTSTIQTRAKYFLFIPWIYKAIEQRRVPSSKVGRVARREEVRLIHALLATGDTEGVIGQEAKEGLQRLPSAIYWNGLRTWGIQYCPDSREQYHRGLDSLYRKRRNPLKGDDGEPVDDGSLATWHPGLPDQPEGFPQTASIELTPGEAQYLQERIITTHSDTLLARLTCWPQHEDCRFLWEHPIIPSLPNSLQGAIAHGRNFSEVMWGASLLYNLLLARALPNGELEADYLASLAEWIELVKARESELRRWVSAKGFWGSPALKGARIPERTRSFVDAWLSLVLGFGATVSSIASNRAAVNLIKAREYMLKRGRARLHNRRALDRWGGSAGAARLDYRWPNVKTILKDIYDGTVGGAGLAQN